MCIHICVYEYVYVYMYMYFPISLVLPIICAQSGYEVKITIRTKAHT